MSQPESDCSEGNGGEVVSGELVVSGCDGSEVFDFIEEARYSIINLNGQTLRQGNLTKGESTLDLSTISSGLYFIKLKTEKGNITKKVIKK